MKTVADDEAAVIGRASAGDRTAFAQLVRTYQSTVRNQLRRLTRGDHARADDLAQEAFVDAWRNLPGYRAEARFSSWLYRIAYHRFLMDQRRHQDTEELQDDTIDRLASTRPADDRQALRMDIERALDRLPDGERIALIHCYFLDLAHDEAAALMGIPLGTLKTHILRGKARLRTTLSAWEARAA